MCDGSTIGPALKSRTRKRGRPCPRCRSLIRARKTCPVCSISLVREPWQLTPARIRGLRALAHGRKGLDEETYHLRLSAIGVTSTKDLTRELYNRFRTGLLALPDTRAWVERRGQANRDP